MQKLLIIGGSHPTAVGGSLKRAAADQGLEHEFLDFGEAYAGPRLLRTLSWRLRDKRPPRMAAFNRKILEVCSKKGRNRILCAGNMPLHVTTVASLKKMGVQTTIWLTDDPWNPSHRSRWLLEALREYDILLTPRRANMDELNALAPGRVHYLPFGYEPQFFHATPEILEPSPRSMAHEVFFAGGADQDRVSFMQEIAASGLELGLYGALWERFPETKGSFRGYAAPDRLSGLIANSLVSLCLVRQANRDGHCMRTFELAAAGGCILAEDTPEHRSIFGPDGSAVAYFSGQQDVAEKCAGLIRAPDTRLRLRRAAHRLIANGQHTYSQRLSMILETGGTI
jgi:spore maturation protein CgeB